MCGEKLNALLVVGSLMGSPPRVRGKEGAYSGIHPLGGITPACAGKRQARRSVHDSRRDHPRVCGEKRSIWARGSVRRGSPPRVRGKVCVIGRAARVGGITPACAGKSIRNAPSSVLFGDHPRVCGEKFFPKGLQIGGEGSPPRVRGKAAHWAKAVSAEGITPACAGKRTAGTLEVAKYKDHPRVCGEKLWNGYQQQSKQGSPPRVRGKVHSDCHASAHKRITPACAGKR